MAWDGLVQAGVEASGLKCMPSAEANVYMPSVLPLLGPPHVAIILIRSSAGTAGLLSMNTVPVS